MIRFRMVGIKTKQFAILEDVALPESEPVDVSTKLQYKVATNMAHIACDVLFAFKAKAEVFMQVEVVCEFEIHPDDWAAMQSGKLLVVPKPTLEILAVHTIGTARGVLHCKTEGTAYNRYIIPPINVASMIKGDMSFDMSKE